MLRRADLGCGIEPVISVMLEKREIEIPAKYGPALLLGKELANMGTGVGEPGRVRIGRLNEEHDDLVIACALGCWPARWKERSMWGDEEFRIGVTDVAQFWASPDCGRSDRNYKEPGCAAVLRSRVIRAVDVSSTTST